MLSHTEHDEVELPAECGQLSSLIDEKPEAFASGDKDIQDVALAAAKYIFDLTLKSEERAQPHLKELLQSMEPTQGPQTRAQARSIVQQEQTQKRTLNRAILKPTPLSALFVEGMDADQIWAQLELKAENVCATLEEAFDAGDVDARGLIALGDDESDEDEDDELSASDVAQPQKEGFELGDRKMDEDKDGDSEEDEEGETEWNKSGEENLEESIMDLRDPSSEEEDMDLDAGPSPGLVSSHRSRTRKHTDLDKGFFSLADFNAEIEEAEAKRVSRGSLSKCSDDEDSDEENELDLFAPIDDDEQLDENLDLSDSEAYYKSFFDPPPKAARPAKRKADGTLRNAQKSSKVRFNDQVKVKTIKSKGKGRPLSSLGFLTKEDLDEEDDDVYGLVGNLLRTKDMNGSEEDEDVEEADSEVDSSVLDEGREAVERLKDDLFAEDDDVGPKTGLSTHEARLEAMRKQIADLEAENVGEKDWMLKGEVTARTRPQNALLEEDLEFERLTKAVPVLTDEAVHDLEARIKARIVEGRYDDVVRKRVVDDKPFLPSRVFELQDTKSKESLAQIYENEYMAAQSGGTADDRDGKLQKEQADIEKQWEDICYKLDALCNARFTPKQPKATITTVSNVPAVSLESALPTAKAASTILAPEEVFAPKRSDLQSRTEFTPAQKQALRAKERKKKKKQRELLDKSVDKFGKLKGVKGVKKQKEAALKSMVKTGKGVTVIGGKKNQDIKKGKRQDA